MAIAGGDGSIILTTRVDTSGISKGSNNIKSILQSVGNSTRAMSAKIQNAFAHFKSQKETLKIVTEAIKEQQIALSALNAEYLDLVARGKNDSAEAKKLKGDIEQLTAEMRDLENAANAVKNKGTTAFNGIGRSIKRFAGYFIGIQTFFAFVRFSNEAGQLATQTEASVQRLIDIYGEAAQSVGDFIDANARGLGISRAAAASFASVYGNLFSVWADQATNAELTNAFLNQTAVIASKTGRTMEDVQERIRSGLLGNTEAVEDLGVFVNIKTIEITDAFKKIANGRSWEQLNAYEQQQVRALAILEQSTKKYGNQVAETSALSRARFSAAWEDFKNTWGQVVNRVLIPVLDFATDILNALTLSLQKIAQLSGKTIESTNGLKSNQKKYNNELKETKELQDSLTAGFDTLNTLSGSQVKTAQDQGIGTTQITGDMLSGLNVNVNYNANDEELKQAQNKLENIAGLAASIGTIFGTWKLGGILAKLGLISAKTNGIFKGVGFIAAGIIDVFIASTNWNDAAKDGENTFNAILVTLGDIFVVIGLILLGVAAWPVLLVGGLVALGVWFDNHKKAVNKWIDELPSGIREMVSIIKTVAVGLWDFIKNLFKGIGEIFSGEAEKGLKRIGIAFVNVLIASLNIIIELINYAIVRPILNIAEGALKLAKSLGIIKKTPSWTQWKVPQVDYIPQLARGAVLPANKPFLAQLGDQKHGRNLEAPEDLIRQIVREESGSGNRNITIQATGSMAQLIRMLNLEIRDEQKRASVF